MLQREFATQCYRAGRQFLYCCTTQPRRPHLASNAHTRQYPQSYDVYLLHDNVSSNSSTEEQCLLIGALAEVEGASFCK